MTGYKKTNPCGFDFHLMAQLITTTDLSVDRHGLPIAATQ